MRFNYYFSVKGRQKEAMKMFAGLSGQRPNEVCEKCEGYCESACPYGVKTRSVLAMAENNLSWNDKLPPLS